VLKRTRWVAAIGNTSSDRKVPPDRLAIQEDEDDAELHATGGAGEELLNIVAVHPWPRRSPSAPPEQPVAHAAAGEVGRVACRAQTARDRPRAAS